MLRLRTLMNKNIEELGSTFDLMAAPPACTWRMGGVASVLRAIANPTRRQILDLLAVQDLTVTRVANQFDMSRHAIIKHLHILHSAKLVSVRRSGRERIQSLNAEPLEKVEAWISRFAPHSDNSRQRLEPALQSDLSNAS